MVRTLARIFMGVGTIHAVHRVHQQQTLELKNIRKPDKVPDSEQAR
jgi:hypothetical protein